MENHDDNQWVKPTLEAIGEDTADSPDIDMRNGGGPPPS